MSPKRASPAASWSPWSDHKNLVSSHSGRAVLLAAVGEAGVRFVNHLLHLLHRDALRERMDLVVCQSESADRVGVDEHLRSRLRELLDVLELVARRGRLRHSQSPGDLP